MFFTVSGPLDKLNMMDINGTIETISLKLSPPIVRLIIHAVQTLALTSVSTMITIIMQHDCLKAII